MFCKSIYGFVKLSKGKFCRTDLSQISVEDCLQLVLDLLNSEFFISDKANSGQAAEHLVVAIGFVEIARRGSSPLRILELLFYS